MSLLTPVQSKKVKTTLFNMHSEKSFRPDGTTPGFYKKYWNIVIGDLVQLVDQFFTTGMKIISLTPILFLC